MVQHSKHEEQRTKNKEQRMVQHSKNRGTKNRGTENKEQGNGEQGNGEQGRAKN
jgi:hypothetical protein